MKIRGSMRWVFEEKLPSKKCASLGGDEKIKNLRRKGLGCDGKNF